MVSPPCQPCTWIISNPNPIVAAIPLTIRSTLTRGNPQANVTKGCTKDGLPSLSYVEQLRDVPSRLKLLQQVTCL